MDAQGRPLDGGKTYRLHLPPNIPAKDFWSLVRLRQPDALAAADRPAVPEHRQPEGGRRDQSGRSVDVYFGPKPPAGKESNWVQTLPGKGWNVILRLYGPLQPLFDQTWRPGEIEAVR